MKLSRLKNKILFGAVSISVLVTLASMCAVSWVIRQQILAQSTAQLLDASKLIENNLKDRKENLLMASRQLAVQKNIGSTIWYLAQYAQAGIDRETLFFTYQQLLNDTYNIGRVTNLSRVAFYDSAGNLVSFVLFDSDSKTVGFVESHPNRLFQVATLKNGVNLDRKNLHPTNSVPNIDFKFSGPLPQRESINYAVKNGLLVIECHVPIMGDVLNPKTGKLEARQLGLLETIQSLDQAFVDHLARPIDVKINVFAAQGFSSGELTNYRTPDWGSEQTGPGATTPVKTLNEISIAGEGFYQYLIPIYAENQLIGSFAALHSKEIVQKYTWEMIRTLGVIAVACLLFILPFAWYFATSISHPLTALCQIFRGIAAGDQAGTLNNELSRLESMKNLHDELGELTSSFIAMDNTINLKIQEITELYQHLDHLVQQRTEQLQFVLEGSQLGFWDWNISTGKVEYNERWAAMLGFSLAEVEMNLKQWSDLVHSDDLERAWQSVNDHLAGRTPWHVIEYRMLTRDGHYIWILDQGKIVARDADNQPQRMTGTHTDITERKLTEQLRIRTQVECEERSRMARELHDGSGQALQAIRLHLQLLATGKGCGDLHFELGELARSVGETASELRDLSHQLRPAYLQEVNLDAALLDRCSVLTRRGVPIRLDYTGDFSALPDLVSDNFYRVFQEALSNAVRHAGAKGIKIDLTRSGSRLTLNVTDDGHGIDAERSAHGLGLQIMQERATLIGATLTISSNTSGTSVTLTQEDV